jgi:molybdopterin converting factor small subunit
MRVKVYAPGYCDYTHINKNGFVDLDEGATLGVLLNKIKMPLLLRALPVVAVNNKKVPKSTVLQDGDTISILFIVAGG